MPLRELIEADWERVFADCGEEVIYRVVSREWDEDFLAGEETVDDVPVVALVGNAGDPEDRPAGGQSVAGGRDVLVRLADLPADCPQLTDRLVIAGVEYGIEGFSQQPRGEVVKLRGIRRAEGA